VTRFERETISRLAGLEKAVLLLCTKVDLLLQSEQMRNSRVAALDVEVKSNRERISSLFAIVQVPEPEGGQ